MRVALDTNVLVYAEGVGSKAKQARSLALVEQLDSESVVLPVQTLGELYRVLAGKVKRPAGESREAVLEWSDAYPVADSTWAAFQAAFDLSVDHMLSIWDALILSVAAEQRCRVVLSEDMQSGFTWRGLTVVNPYARRIDPLLADIVDLS